MNNCTDITPLCPVEATTYGYYPHLGGNIVFLVLFAILCCCQVFFGVRYRVWAYSAVTAVGCMGEAVGYGGRLIMNKNPWSDSGFQMQIVCLILSPSFIAAGIYLTFKHLTLHFGPEYSRIKPFLYTWIFIGCDITSILLQAAGGGVAGSAGKNDIALLTAGNNIMIAGIAFQVATMTVCGVLAVDFGIRLVLRRRKQTDDKPHQADWKARVFCAAVGFSYITLLIRCVYRLPEMAGGWGNPRMRNEKEFLILDGLMVLLSSLGLTIAHPGYTFPAMSTTAPAKPASIDLDVHGHRRLESE